MYLEKNLAVLKRRYPAYAEIIRNAPLTGRYQAVKANNGEINIMDVSTNLFFYNNIAPTMDAAKDISVREIVLSKLAIFLGSALFFQTLEYLKKYKNSGVVVIENDPELLKIALTHINYSELFNYEKFYLILAGPQMDIDLYEVLCDKDNKFFCKSFNIIEHPLSFSTNKDFYMAAINVLKHAVLTMLVRYGNDPDDGLLGIKNTFININTIIENPGIKDLKNAFKNKPGIVVSAGPSLDKNIHLLEGLYDKAVIVGADTVLPVLQKNGFKPHMVTSLERISLVAKLYENQTKESTENIFLAACPVIPKEAYDAFPGEKIIVYRDFATFKWIDIDKGLLDIGPSAGNMAFNVLEYMGCSPIILIGQDFAYADDGDISHVSGTVLGDKQQSQHAALYVEGSILPKVKTMAVWNLFRDFYEIAISKTKAVVIDATEGGAKIKGTEIMDFSVAIEKNIKGVIDPLSTIRRKLKKPFAAAKVTETKKLLKKVEEAISFSDVLINSFASIVEKYNELYIKLENNLFDPISDETKKLIDDFYGEVHEREKTFNTKEFFLIFMHYVQAYLISSIVEINEMKNRKKTIIQDDMAIFRSYTEMFLTIAKLISIMKLELEKMKESLENNL